VRRWWFRPEIMVTGFTVVAAKLLSLLFFFCSVFYSYSVCFVFLFGAFWFGNGCLWWLVVICGYYEWKWKWRWWWMILQNLYILLLIFFLFLFSPLF
jgi:hypothetical protein